MRCEDLSVNNKYMKMKQTGIHLSLPLPISTCSTPKDAISEHVSIKWIRSRICLEVIKIN